MKALPCCRLGPLGILIDVGSVCDNESCDGIPATGLQAQCIGKPPQVNPRSYGPRQRATVNGCLIELGERWRCHDEPKRSDRGGSHRCLSGDRKTGPAAVRAGHDAMGCGGAGFLRPRVLEMAVQIPQDVKAMRRPSAPGEVGGGSPASWAARLSYTTPWDAAEWGCVGICRNSVLDRQREWLRQRLLANLGKACLPSPHPEPSGPLDRRRTPWASQRTIDQDRPDRLPLAAEPPSNNRLGRRRAERGPPFSNLIHLAKDFSIVS